MWKKLSVVLLLLALLWGLAIWRNRSRPLSDNSITQSNRPSARNETNMPVAALEAEAKKQLADVGIKPGMSKEQMQQVATNYAVQQYALLAQKWKNPIDFYGKVIDEAGQPVAGVEVQFIWTDTSSKGTSEAATSTDITGQFSLTGKTGRALQVWLSKGDCYVSKTNRIDFDYAEGFVADPISPVIFRVLKKGLGAELITSQYGVRRVLQFGSPKDGVSVMRLDFFNRKIGNDGQMEISQEKPPYGKWQTATNWSYRLTIPDGGLLETTEEFPFEAPSSGYQPVVEFKFQKGEANWTERIDKTFYIAFGTPRKYGRIHVVTSMSSGTTLDYAINPDGSTILEPK